MICPHCHGRGSFPTANETGVFGSSVPASLVCETCGGHGHIHCCEGDQSQPEKDE